MGLSNRSVLEEFVAARRCLALLSFIGACNLALHCGYVVYAGIKQNHETNLKFIQEEVLPQVFTFPGMAVVICSLIGFSVVVSKISKVIRDARDRMAESEGAPTLASVVKWSVHVGKELGLHVARFIGMQIFLSTCISIAAFWAYKFIILDGWLESTGL